MTSTLILVLALLVLLGISFVTKCCLLLIGLRLNKITDYSRDKILLATFLIEACGLALLGALEFSIATSPQAGLDRSLVFLCLIMIVSCAIIARVFKATSWRAFLVWLITLIPAPGLLLFAIFVLRPYVAEAYVIPTNSMAPTLLGRHHEGVCSKCGKPNYYTAFEDRYRRDMSEPQNMICSEFHITNAVPQDSPVFSGDRILVAKFLKPQRWDVVVFRYPEELSLNYVKRLIGLPGETIIIKDGKVYANGQELIPPPELQGIEYLSEFPGDQNHLFPPLWGTEKRPAVLGEGEYFVLGDFSSNAKDSRAWEKRTGAHPPYAVPESHMIGVVTYIYWPLSRYRTFR
jgi:signal peptidase I